MPREKMNAETAFNYLKLGVDIAKLSFLIAKYEEEALIQKEYVELIDICNKRLVRMNIDYSIDELDFIDSLKLYDKSSISKQFKKPLLNEKISLFDIGYHIMLIPLMEVGGENELLNDSDLYTIIKGLLEELKAPTYELLDILFDKHFNTNRRLMLFIYNLCNHFDSKQSSLDEDDRNIDSSSVVAIGGNVILGHDNIVDNKNAISILNNSVNEMFSRLENEIKTNIENNEKILQTLEEMKEQKGSIAYNKKYTEFISLMADHFTILSPFLVMLSDFLK